MIARLQLKYWINFLNKLSRGAVKPSAKPPSSWALPVESTLRATQEEITRTSGVDPGQEEKLDAVVPEEAERHTKECANFQ